MRKIYLLTLICIQTSIGFTQTPATFNGNQIETSISNLNSLFWNSTTGDPGYFFPAGSNNSVIFNFNLWVFGKDSVTHTLKGFGDKYLSAGHDTWPGPLKTDGSASVTPMVMTAFDKVWKITREQLDSFVTEFNNGNVTSFVWPVPPDMINWPVNAAANYEHPHSPFFDNNGDGVYNVYDGDHPIMKGDQMLRWIMNDTYSTHLESGAQPMGLEIQSNFYGCSSPIFTDPLNRTTFLEYTVINRSFQAYEDVYIGLNLDADIGGAADDFVRSNVDAGTIQFYNADSYDSPYSGSGSYGAAPPVQSITLLDIDGQTSQPLISGFMFYNNSMSVTGDPADYTDQYDLLRNMWKDGSHLVYGGNGYPTGPFVTAPPCSYMFPGDSDPTYIGTSGIPTTFDWSEENATGINDVNAAGDRRGIVSVGPFNLSGTGRIKFTIALITTQDSTISKDSLLEKNIAEVTEISQAYLTNSLPCQAGISVGLEQEELNNLVTLFPNPSSDWINIQSQLPIDKIELMNVYGSVIKTAGSTNTIQVQELAEGMYFTRIFMQGHKSPVIKKFMVVK